MSARSRSDGCTRAERALRHQNFRRDFVRAEQAEACSSNNPRHARQQMIVAAAIGRERCAAAPSSVVQIEPHLPERRPHQRADEHHVAAALRARQPQRTCRTGRHRASDAGSRSIVGGLRPRRAAETARTLRPRALTASATASGRLPPPQMIASGPSSPDGRRGAHASSSASPRLIAMVSGRLPARMKSMILPTSASPA